MNKIYVEGLKKRYNLYNSKKDRLKEVFSLTGACYHKEFFALKGISFSVSEGECVGIIGVNGSGKSTLLKILTGVIAQTEGEIQVNGKVSALLELGAGFNPEYTGYENIFLNGTIMGYTKEEMKAKVQDILDFADIGEFINQPVKTYSSGMFVRLAFAIAVNIEPDILIIDEALSVGDIYFQQKCYKKIKELANCATVLIVSHDLNALTKFCNRIIVMNKGEIIYDGEPVEGIATFYKVKQGSITKNKTLTLDNTETICYDLSKFREPLELNYSGSMEVVINKFYYDIDGREFAENCKANNRINFKMLLHSKRDIEELIVGYQIRDKYGMEVFGETSLTSSIENGTLKKGESIIELSFQWPEVREGDYFITLGIGEGPEVLNQTEHCWINNCAHFDVTTEGKVIYGIFNNPIADFKVVPKEKI